MMVDGVKNAKRKDLAVLREEERVGVERSAARVLRDDMMMLWKKQTVCAEELCNCLYQ